jgi:putative PIN family toxin of toxin-antitoxin system
VITALLDSNVLLAGFLTSVTPPGQLIDAWRAGRFELIVSDPLLAEVTRNILKPYFRRRLTADQITDAVLLLTTRARLTAITVQVTGVATHPEDDLILATALSARADYLVTGDAQLLELGSYQGIKIVSARAFLAVLGS